MTPEDPKRTAPRTPPAAPLRDTKSRAADSSSASTGRSAAPATPAGTGTVARTPSDVARLEADALARAAAGVPGYALLRELGRGGMGVVYEARHLKLNRVVALKMMLGGEQAGGDEMARFLAEAEAVAAVEHENVVRVYDFGEADGRPFMALEYCPGGTLTQLLPRAPEQATDPRGTAALVAAVARGVAAAHAAGVVHRDLKPGNVFLDADGTPRVADFGLAKRGEGTDVTRTGVGMGTPSYMAPEQARDAKFVGPPADVWALGVILYQALTGARPFVADSAIELMLRIELDDPVPPRKVVPTVPRDLELICLKCLEKKPSDRYPTAAELADDLDRYLEGRPIRVRPAGPAERAYKWARRNKAATAALAAAACALVVGIGFLVALVWADTQGKKRAEAQAAVEKADDDAEKAKREQEAARQREREAQRARAAAQHAQYVERLLSAAQQRYDNPPEGLRLLEDPDVCPPDRREVAWHILHRVCRREYLTLPDLGATAIAAAPDSKILAVGTGGPKPVVRLLDVETGKEVRALPGHTAGVVAVAFAAAGKVLASADAGGTIRLWEVPSARPEGGDTGAPARVLTAWPKGVRSLAVSPDGRWLAAGQAGHALADKSPCEIKLWDLQKGGDPTTLTGHTGPVCALAFNSAGDTLASTAPDGTARLWDMNPARERHTLKHSGWVTCVAFSPDGKTVVAGNADGVIRVWDASDGREVRNWNGMAAGAYGVAFSPDGAVLATAHEGGKVGVMQVKLWNPNTGKQLFAFDMGKGRIDALTYTPDGRVLAAIDQNGVVRAWRMKLTDEDAVIPAHGRGYAVAYSPDGQTLATGGGFPVIGGEVRLWDAATGAPRRQLGTHRGKVTAVAYAPDGATLASAGDDGTVKLWDVATGAERRAIPAHAKAVRCVAFAPDGHTLASCGEDGAVSVWYTQTGEKRFGLSGHERAVMAVAFSPDGRTLASAGHDGVVRLWDPADGRPKAQWNCGQSQFALAFAPDGETLYCGDKSGVRARRVATGEATATRDITVAKAGQAGWAFSLSLSRDGRTLAIGCTDGTARLWDAVGMRDVLVFSVGGSEDGGVKCVSLSPGGRALAGMGIDGKVRVWR
jgi:WD40 repeat protein/tRNA A-37 threonylcarbamoyl transferase component Bud32